MAQINPFAPQGKCIAVTAAVTAPAPVQAVGFSNAQSPCDYLIYNAGAVDAFITMEALSADATANCVTPTGTPQRSIACPSKAFFTLNGPPNAFFSGITASSTAIIYVTPGEGQ